MKPNQIICGSNIDVVKPWPVNCIDGIVCDPPYGLEFMGKEWDKLNLNVPFSEKETGGLGGYKHHIRFGKDGNAMQQWHYQWAKAMLRITKPGGFLLCFGGTRTYHRLACAIEDAGWEIRDCMMWLYGSGFPKSHNISKAIDKAAGATRKVLGTRQDGCGKNAFSPKDGWHQHSMGKEVKIEEPATELAQLWDGYGTALKPAWEPIIVAMKPLDGTFAHNAEVHGVAGLNIDGGRIGTEEQLSYSSSKKQGVTCFSTGTTKQNPQGRWPANLILDEEAGAMLDEQSGNCKTGNLNKVNTSIWGIGKGRNNIGHKGSSGGASRYFKQIQGDEQCKVSRFKYCAKTSRKERNMGLDDQSGEKVNDGRQTPIDNPYQRGETVRKNTHPTVKPLALMKYLCTLLKMPSAEQIILDPFLGSGTTGMACASLGIGFIGIEKEPEYCEIASKRISAISGKPLPVSKNVETVRTTKDFAGGKCRRPDESLPHVSEHRQSIINAASAALRRKQK